MRKSLLAICVVVLVIALLPSISSGQEPPPAAIQTLFNTPGNWGDAGEIDQAVIAEIDAASPTAEIRAAFFYAYPSNGVVVALNEALGRGVDVRLVLDADAHEENAGRIGPSSFDQYGDPTVDGLSNFRREDIAFCKDTCSPTGLSTRVMHNKFLIVQDPVQQVDSVVVQSSRNLSNSKKHETALLLRGNDRLFAQYERLWTLMAHQEIDNPYGDPQLTSRVDDEIKMYVFPRAQDDPGNDDTIVNVLNSIDTDHECRVLIVAAFFTEARNAVANALRAVSDAGCAVAVVTRSPGVSTANLTGLNVVRTEDVHSKYMIVEGHYGESRAPRQLVFTGSHNLTKAALVHNDEVMLRVETPNVFADYVANFTEIWNSVTDQPTVRISSVLANASGPDLEGGEQVAFTNTTPWPIALDGWKLQDLRGGTGGDVRTSFHFPDIAIAPFATVTITVAGPNADASAEHPVEVGGFLNNGGDLLTLLDGNQVVDRFCYDTTQRAGRPISTATC